MCYWTRPPSSCGLKIVNVGQPDVSIDYMSSRFAILHKDIAKIIDVKLCCCFTLDLMN